MNVTTYFKRARTAHATGVAILVTFLAGCLALSGGEWFTAAQFLSISLMFSSMPAERLRRTAHTNWPRIAYSASGAAFFGIALARVLTGDPDGAIVPAATGAIVWAAALRRSAWDQDRPST